MAYPNLETLITAMLYDVSSTTASSLRKSFHDEPHVVMEDYGLTDPERALLFTMDRNLIMAEISELQPLIKNYIMEADWSEQGEDWPAPKGAWIPVPSYAAAVANESSGSSAPIAGLDTRGGWGDPGPHGRGFHPTGVTRSKAESLTLVGEGFLATARITIQQGSHLREIPVEKINFQNFRRTYLRTKKFTIDQSWPAGEYEVRVQNDPTYDPLLAGHFLSVA
jgi:hypothetical protein